MLTAVFFLGNEIHFMEYTLKSLKRFLESIESSDFVTFSICNDEENIITDKYVISYDFPSPADSYNICKGLMEEYEKIHNTNFRNIFITRTNSIYNITSASGGLIDIMSASGGLNNNDGVKFYTSIPDIHEQIDIKHWIQVDSVILKTDSYYYYRGEDLYNKILQIPQEYLSSVFDNVLSYDKIPQIDLGGKIAFFITSVVNIDLNFHNSKWSPDERLKQVIRTATSIRKYVPNAVIFHLEGSVLNIHQIAKISQYTDYLILFNDEHYKSIVNYPHNKSKFEMFSIIHMLNNIQNYKWFCKISGRYRIIPKFDPQRFFTALPTFFHNDGMVSYNYTHPVLYSIPVQYKDKYIAHLLSMDLPYHNIEHILFCFAYRIGIQVNWIRENLWAIGYPAYGLTAINC